MIEIRNISKPYKNTPVLKDVNFLINDGEFVVLIVKNGCGKTTLFKMTNRLHTLTAGKILTDEYSVSRLNETKLRRRIGYVVQDGGSFPHIDIENYCRQFKLYRSDHSRIYVFGTYRGKYRYFRRTEIFTARFPALENGGIDMYAGQTGTEASAILKEKLTSDPALTYDTLKKGMENKGIYVSAPLGFENTYVMSASPEAAARCDLKTISGLFSAAAMLRLGCTSLFTQRGDLLPRIEEEYGVRSASAAGLEAACGTRRSLPVKPMSPTRIRRMP